MILTADQVKACIEAKEIAALSLDTNIFEEAGFGFEHGSLALLRQFVGTGIRFVLQDVVVREVLAHTTESAQLAENELRHAMKGMGNSWNLDREMRAEYVHTIQGGESAQEVSRRRFEDFAQAAAIVQIPSYGVDVSRLVEDYFSKRPPFGVNAPKAEFPDAIALHAMERWAREEGRTKILVVSKDGDWRRYCEQSEELILVAVLGEALSYFHARSDLLAMKLAEQMGAGAIAWQDTVIDEMQHQVESLSFVPEAPNSGLYYDSELDEVSVNRVTLATSERGLFNLRPVERGDDHLVVRVSAVVTLDLLAHFYFSVKDGIDRDQVSVGSASASAEFELPAELLITFSTIGEEPEVLDVEAEFSRTDHWVEFAGVDGPEWDED